jgi:EAL domain-containing protein (putative c-di-GMP-specific phosphodiesterase class I)
MNAPAIGPILVLARDPRVIEAVREAARGLHAEPPIALVSPAAALLWLIAPGERAPRLVCEPDAAGLAWPDLLRAATDPFAPAAIIAVQPRRSGLPEGVASVPAHAPALAAALSAAAPARRASGEADAGQLRRALERGEVTARFQPIVSIAGRQPVGCEALARWQSSVRGQGVIPPDSFVPLAERTGLARALTLIVLGAALRDFAAAGPPPLTLSVNLPLSVLLRPEVPALIRSACQEAGLPTTRLTLELTETMRVEDPPLLRRALERLRAAGHGVRIDDWTHADPRRRLLDLPFTGVKLDPRLVAALPHARVAREAVERLVAACDRRGLDVTAEGVATPAMWRAVASAGVAQAQGFAIGRPMAGESLPAWLRAWRAARVSGWDRGALRRAS